MRYALGRLHVDQSWHGAPEAIPEKKGRPQMQVKILKPLASKTQTLPVGEFSNSVRFCGGDLMMK